jgi:NAD(P)-dependent dehydrogenase (short-subunit alcohol dehydrogenase family)
LFTTLLVPQLRAASTPESPSRVGWTSSFLAEGASPTNGIDLDLLDKGTTDKIKNYAISKAGTWMLGREFARRCGRDGIVSVIQNPGNLKNEGWKKVDAVTMFFVKHVLHEPRFGAYTELHAGLSRDITLENNGAYVIPWGRLRPDEGCPRKDILNAMTAEEESGLGYAEKLWDWCELKWKPFV